MRFASASNKEHMQHPVIDKIFPAFEADRLTEFLSGIAKICRIRAHYNLVSGKNA